MRKFSVIARRLVRVATAVAVVTAVARAQLPGIPPGAETAAMSGAVAADSAELWSAAVNPASCADRRQFSVEWSSMSLALDDMRSDAVIAAIPWAPVTACAMISSDAADHYRDVGLAVSAAMRLSGSLALGVRAGVTSIAVDRYGAATGVTIDCGARLTMLPQLIFGASATNIFGTTIGASDAELPRQIRLGLAVIPHPALLLTGDAIGTGGESAALLVGARLRAHEHLSISAGFSSDPPVYSAGITIVVAGIIVSYAYAPRSALTGPHVISAGLIL